MTVCDCVCVWCMCVVVYVCAWCICVSFFIQHSDGDHDNSVIDRPRGERGWDGAGGGVRGWSRRRGEGMEQEEG